MNTTPWTSIPSKLTDAGFSVHYERVSYDPNRPLWCARAWRDGHQWSASGKDLPAALEELGNKTMVIINNWRELITQEKLKTDLVFQHAA